MTDILPIDLHKTIIKKGSFSSNNDNDNSSANDNSFTHKEEDLFEDFIFEKRNTNDKNLSLPIRYLGYNAFRIITAVILTILLVILLTLIILYYLIQDYIESLLCFQLKDKNSSISRTPFLSDPYSFLICLIVIILNIVPIIHFMIKNNKVKIYPYLNEMSFGLPLTLILLILRLLLSACIKLQFWLYFVHLWLAMPSIALIAVFYVKKKSKLYDRVVKIVNESCFVSLLMGLYCYEVLYVLYRLFPLSSINKIDIYVGIGFNVVFFCIALCLLTIFKDIVFTLFLGVIEMGLLTQSAYNDIYETVAAIVILLFIFVSSVLMIFKYKTKVLGYVEEENINTIVYDTDKLRLTI